jgi:hypothetical protein
MSSRSGLLLAICVMAFFLQACTERKAGTSSASQTLQGSDGRYQQNDSSDENGDPPKLAAAKRNPECAEESVTTVSEDERVLVLSNDNRYLIPDEYQATTSTWEGTTVYYCNGGTGHRYFVNEGGESVPVGALDE